MRSQLVKADIKDEVVRARCACWRETVQKELIDVTKFARIAVVQDEFRGDIMFGVLAYPKADTEEGFDVLYEDADENKCLDYYRNLVHTMTTPLSLVH